jgi:L-ascorbate metabolism protein UlaG (beta-lactamase superfamily)
MINVMLLANAGLLIDTGRFRLLADGLYSDTGHTFSTIPRETEKQLMAGGGELGQIQYLLFTHLHPDHFDRYKTNEFTEKHDVHGVYFPLADGAEMDIEVKEFIEAQRDSGVYTEPLILERGESRRIILGDDTEITAFCTGHMGAQYSDVPNICYLLKADGSTLLVTGDADSTISTVRWTR